MKIIKSKKYIRKIAIWSLPGDSSLPSDVTEREISERGQGVDDDIVSNQQGESEINVNWQEFNKWFVTGGSSLPEELVNRSPSPVKLTYTYSYNYSGGIDGQGEIGDIKAVQLDDYGLNRVIADKYILESFVDFYNNKIKEDISIGERDTNDRQDSVSF